MRNLKGGPIGSLRIGHPLLQIVVLVIKVLHNIISTLTLDLDVLSPDLKDHPHGKVDFLMAAALDQHGPVVLQCLCCCDLVKL